MGALTNLSSADFLTATVSYVSQPSQPRNEVQMLIDTGSLAGNFVALRVIKNFHLQELIIFDKTLTVCSALDGKCYNISKSINLKMTYFSERLNKNIFLDCDSTGSRVPILPGTDSTGSYRVLLLYTTVRLSYRRSHLQRPLRS